MTAVGRTSPVQCDGWRVRKRRFFPVALHPGEGLLTERTADALACRYGQTLRVSALGAAGGLDPIASADTVHYPGVVDAGPLQAAWSWPKQTA